MLKKYFEGLTTPAVVTNSAFQIIATNPLFQDAFGPGSRTKNNLIDFVKANDHGKFKEAYTKWLTPPKTAPCFVQCSMKLTTGLTEECQIFIRTFNDEENNERVYLSEFQAVAADNRIPIQENGFLNKMREICFRIDLNGILTEVNSAALETLGYSSINKILGINVLKALSLSQTTLQETKIWKQLQEGNGKVTNYESLIPTKNGGEVLLSSNIHFYYDANLNIAGFEGFATDVTDYRALIKKLTKTLSFNKSLLASIPTPLMWKNKDLVLEGCNQAFEDLTGMPWDEIKSKKIGKIWPEEFAIISEQKERIALESGTLQIIEGFIANKEKQSMAIIMVTACFRDEDGKPAGVISSFLDVTARKTVELAIKKQEEGLLRNSNRFQKIINPHLRKTVMVGNSPAVMKLYDQILMAAQTNMPVLIEGESGTGKELVANEIHRHSDRGKKPLVAINCTAIPKHLAESTFFGHTKGAFTGALQDSKGHIRSADGTSLFLDEINSIPLDMQAKLLRVIETGEVMPVGSGQVVKSNFRLITASNQNMTTLNAKGIVRSDFYYRLTVLTIKVPPLRNRKEDIPMLAYHFLTQYKQEHSSSKSFLSAKKYLTKELFQKLNAYDFPGNVRELRNILWTYFTTGKLKMQPPEPEPEESPVNDPVPSESGIPEYKASGPLKDVLATVEKDYIIRALERFRYNKTKVAGYLGVTRKTLYNKMVNYNLD